MSIIQHELFCIELVMRLLLFFKSVIVRCTKGFIYLSEKNRPGRYTYLWRKIELFMARNSSSYGHK